MSNIKIKESHTVTLSTEVEVSKNTIKTHDCEVGEWYGEKICTVVDISGSISDLDLPKGRYLIEVLIKKIED